MGQRDHNLGSTCTVTVGLTPSHVCATGERTPTIGEDLLQQDVGKLYGGPASEDGLLKPRNLIRPSRGGKPHFRKSDPSGMKTHLFANKLWG